MFEYRGKMTDKKRKALESCFLTDNMEFKEGCFGEKDFDVLKLTIKKHRETYEGAASHNNTMRGDRPSMIGVRAAARKNDVEQEWAQAWMPPLGSLTKDVVWH